MSTTFFSWTYPVRTADLMAAAGAANRATAQSGERTADDLLALMTFDAAAGHTIACASNGGKLDHMLRELADVFGAGALLCVVDDAGTPMRDASGYQWRIAVLDAAAIDGAAVSVDRLLLRAAEAPQDFNRLLAFHGRGTAATVRQALHSASALLDPDMGLAGEEDGDGPVYLFSFLKCLQGLLRHAQENGMQVIHAKHLP
jgi:hypothetical protein